MTSSRLVFRVHVIQRMAQRKIASAEIRAVLATGETIEEYPHETPYPSRLVLGWSGSRPLHVVVAENPGEAETIVITMYEPAPNEWEPGFRRRRPA